VMSMLIAQQSEIKRLKTEIEKLERKFSRTTRPPKLNPNY